MRKCPEPLQGKHQGLSRRNTPLPPYTRQVCSLGLSWLCICNSVFLFLLDLWPPWRFCSRDLSTTSWGSFSCSPLRWSSADVGWSISPDRGHSRVLCSTPAWLCGAVMGIGRIASVCAGRNSQGLFSGLLPFVFVVGWIGHRWICSMISIFPGNISCLQWPPTLASISEAQ